jgi:hypothetical protein
MPGWKTHKEIKRSIQQATIAGERNDASQEVFSSRLPQMTWCPTARAFPRAPWSMFERASFILQTPGVIGHPHSTRQDHCSLLDLMPASLGVAAILSNTMNNS